MPLEHERRHHRGRPNLIELPPELAAFLAGEPFACLTHATNLGTAFICKAPGREIARIPHRVSVSVRYELHDYPAAPVIRTLLRVYDRLPDPLTFESFINVAEPDQRQDFAALARQPEILLLFYDERLSHRRMLRLPKLEDDPVITDVLERAEALAHRIPVDRYDFDRAKAAVMARTTL
jgi:hypothetical protein